MSGESRLVQNFRYSPYEQYEQIPNGRFTEPCKLTYKSQISIPQNHSFTTDVDGTLVSCGQDGVGLAHRDSKGFMAIG